MKDNRHNKFTEFDPLLVSSLVLAQFLGTMFMRLGDGLFMATIVYAVCLTGPFLAVGLYRSHSRYDW